MGLKTVSIPKTNRQTKQKIKEKAEDKKIEMEKQKTEKLNKIAEEKAVKDEKAIARVKQTLLRKETAQKTTQEEAVIYT